MLSIVVPTYNERGNVLLLISRLDKALAGLKYEVVFVDDNSSDGTAECIREMAQAFPVTVVVRKEERGLATAVLAGIRYAKGDTVCVMDADLQHPPEIVPKLLAALCPLDVEFGTKLRYIELVVGSRYIPGGGCPNWGLLRRVISRGATLLAHVALPRSRCIHDPMSGFYMFRKKCIEGIKFQPIGYKILLEMIVLGKFDMMDEVPFIFEDRESGKSKMRLRQQLDYLRHLVSLRRRSKTCK